jgi:type-2 restriction enzyme mboI
MKKDFNEFMSQLQETNQTLESFCDFEKISQNVDNIKLSLCMLNSLIGTLDLRKSVKIIWQRDPSAFNVLDILIAIRNGDEKKFLTTNGECRILSELFESPDKIVEYLESTGLANIFRDNKIQNLVDYVFGIETGLDSNARKNRSGKIMEHIVADIFNRNKINYRQEVFSEKWAPISKVLGKDKKRFDFVVETSRKIYLIEVNFYNSGGSKPNEVARSYSEIAPKINSLPGFEFIWITDGKGWEHAKNKLQEAYNVIPRIYNLTSINELINLLKSE